MTGHESELPEIVAELRRKAQECTERAEAAGATGDAASAKDWRFVAEAALKGARDIESDQATPPGGIGNVEPVGTLQSPEEALVAMRTAVALLDSALGGPVLPRGSERWLAIVKARDLTRATIEGIETGRPAERRHG